MHTGIRGAVIQKRVTALVANLPGRIAERETETVEQMFSGVIESRIIDTKLSLGPGNAVMVEVESDAATEIFTCFGELGVTAENVAKEAVREAREYLVSKAVVGQHLSDQLLLPLAIAGEGSFTALKLTQHAITNMEVIQLFLPVSFQTANGEDHIEVRIRSA